MGWKADWTANAKKQLWRRSLSIVASFMMYYLYAIQCRPSELFSLGCVPVLCESGRFDCTMPNHVSWFDVRRQTTSRWETKFCRVRICHTTQHSRINATTTSHIMNFYSLSSRHARFYRKISYNVGMLMIMVHWFSVDCSGTTLIYV